jgi:hypothetical protein
VNGDRRALHRAGLSAACFCPGSASCCIRRTGWSRRARWWRSTRRLGAAFAAWRAGGISFAKLDAAVQGWINHVRYADSWGLRERVLGRLVW